MNKLFIEDLIALIKEYPDMEIMCKVDSDIVADDGYAWWLGSINTRNKPYIDEYATVRERIVFKSEEEWTDWFEELYDVDDFQDIPDSEWEDFCQKKLEEELEWKKVIFISVTTP